MKILFKCVRNDQGNIHLKASEADNGAGTSAELYSTLHTDEPGTPSDASEAFEVGKVYEVTIEPK